ncbi:Branched-chain alpha-keto acid dehydrogenase, E1 component, beta subunit [hydrothermal vent metagenome]|uniref:Branched-chain alpha-keto acid dehydrogenase, E1 component, beta subunit n=1 Tax=hydrothermal vent metagenome TaxID=652676 RepID=A0A3B1CQ14_9ZZZZ
MINDNLDVKLFTNMLRIRIVEEELARVYPEWQIRCPVHFCIGQEAPPVGVIEALNPEDTVMSHHRAHGHYLAKGGDLKKMTSELYGKENGCSSGKGGSMHLIDLSANFLGSSSIVSGTIPVALGVGFSFKLKGENAVSTVFFGDGATEEGGFYECINFAALHKVPILFVCENNFYSIYSNSGSRRPAKSSIHEIARAIGVESCQVDGNDARLLYDTAKKALENIRGGKGPFLIEALTYRWLEHCGPFYDDDLGYRPVDEIQGWRENDPLIKIKNRLLSEGVISEEFVAEKKQNFLSEINQAIDHAKKSRFPDSSHLKTDVYSSARKDHPEPGKTNRLLTFVDAVREAIEISMDRDQNVFTMGLGAKDPKRIFNTTTGLIEKFGADRVFESPVSETAMTGVAIGSAINGMRPVLSHQRSDFSLMAMDQLINNAAKWRYMFGGATGVPITVRTIVGRGWGQGPQHSQNFLSMMAHIPGLKVVTPATAFEAKGLLIASIEDDDPVIFIEHRWLHNNKSYVPEGYYSLPIGKASILQEGSDLTIVGAMEMSIEALRASRALAKQGISVEVVNLRSVKPLDKETIISSVHKTGRLLALDPGWRSFSVSAEILAVVAEAGLGRLKADVRRIGLPDVPSPSTPALTKYYYPSVSAICDAVGEMLGVKVSADSLNENRAPHDAPDNNFTGPF